MIGNKKMNRGCNKTPLRTDIYGGEVISQMWEQFSAADLEGKSIDELKTLLADERLLMSDSDASNDLILRIAAVIHAKENKTEAQLEAERAAFWSGLAARYGSAIPVLPEYAPRERGQGVAGEKPGTKSDAARFFRRLKSRNPAGRLAIAAILAAALLLGNAFAAFAFHINVLRMVVDFTDDLFSKTFVSGENTPNPENAPQIGDTPGFTELQDALDEYGIISPRAPGHLPGGFECDFVQASVQPDYVKISAQYESGERVVTMTVRLYSDAPEGRAQYIEKSEGDPVVYSYFGIDFYIFKNIDRTVASWTDGMADCKIQGDVSDEEIKTIINSIYSEE
jgi:hypothetical protein